MVSDSAPPPSRPCSPTSVKSCRVDATPLLLLCCPSLGMSQPPQLSPPRCHQEVLLESAETKEAGAAALGQTGSAC